MQRTFAATTGDPFTLGEGERNDLSRFERTSEATVLTTQRRQSSPSLDSLEIVFRSDSPPRL